MKNPVTISHFQNQAKACRNMGSPFTASLCEHLISHLDEKTKTGFRIENWPGDPAADALALRLCGALQSITISNPEDAIGQIYPNGIHSQYTNILISTIKSYDDYLSSWLDLPPQTNETGRASALLPGLLHISRQTQQPIQLIEIGSSAGLNLQLDHFFYQYDAQTWGDPSSPVKLIPEISGVNPNLKGQLAISSTTGCDLSPLDIRDKHSQLRLRSYVWPDQQYRVDRLNGAIKLALQTPPELLAMDAADFVEAQLANRTKNNAFVLMHSIVWQYLPHQTQRRIESAMHKYGAKADHSNPIFWLRLEGMGGKEPGASLMLDKWPDHNTITLARSCFHGNWIEFL